VQNYIKMMKKKIMNNFFEKTNFMEKCNQQTVWVSSDSTDYFVPNMPEAKIKNANYAIKGLICKKIYSTLHVAVKKVFLNQ
jgi:hypothetical protein